MPEYIVKKGDNLWNIAKNNNTTVAKLKKYNSIKGDVIYEGQSLKTAPTYEYYDVNTKKERLREHLINQGSNVSIIQNAQHNGNYAIVDKNGHTISIFDKNNNLLYSSNRISTGISQKDYNTRTYTNSKGSIIPHAGNESTPAGITKITSVGTYHDAFSFQRSRLDDEGNVRYVKVNGELVPDNIASSIHYGDVTNPFSSNGCIRADKETLNNLSKYLTDDTDVYTLPTDNNSYYKLKGGNLTFLAKNTYGDIRNKGEKFKTDITGTKRDMHDWDDMNVTRNYSYNPLKILHKRTGNTEYDTNVKDYASSLVNNKKVLMKELGIDSDTYDKFAELAMGIAEQESKFGTSKGYKAKNLLPDIAINALRDPTKNGKVKFAIKGFVNPIGQILPMAVSAVKHRNDARSRGINQIKINGDNKELQALYKKYGIDENTIKDTKKSALATILRLGYMYNNEINKTEGYKNKAGEQINIYDALLYKYMGKNYELTNKTATPRSNNYIHNVNKYSNQFTFLSTRKREKNKYGGLIHLEDL